MLAQSHPLEHSGPGWFQQILHEVVLITHMLGIGLT